MNMREPKQQWIFSTKVDAKSFCDNLKSDRSIRLSGRCTVRKSLPEYRHGGSPGFSVFFKGLGLMDTSDSSKLARRMGGRKWGKI